MVPDANKFTSIHPWALYVGRLIQQDDDPDSSFDSIVMQQWHNNEKLQSVQCIAYMTSQTEKSPQS